MFWIVTYSKKNIKQKQQNKGKIKNKNLNSFQLIFSVVNNFLDYINDMIALFSL